MSKKEGLTNLEICVLEEILKALLKDRSARVSRHWLCAVTKKSDRRVREIIHDLRTRGLYIISDSQDNGYWYGTDDEWNAFCDRERKAALNRLHRKTWENGRQLRIEVEE